MDFELTDDGDILLGQQLIDEEGYLIYYAIDAESPNEHPRITRDLDEATIPIRDFKTIREDEEKLQLIQTRLKTENPDWFLYENVGASLTDFIGERNTPDTAKLVEDRVLSTLLRNGAFVEEELAVEVIPVEINEILVDVELDSENIYLRYAFSLNFSIGINNVFVLNRNGEIIDREEKLNPDIYEGLPVYQEGYWVEEDFHIEEEELIGFSELGYQKLEDYPQLDFPNLNIKTIKENAFAGNEEKYQKIYSINLSSLTNLVSIEDSAFAYTDAYDIIIGKLQKLETIGKRAFYNSYASSPSLAALISLKEVGTDAFKSRPQPEEEEDD